jgi:hypothetical protein
MQCRAPRAELRNEEVLLPQDARELDAQTNIRRVFGDDWGSVALIFTPDGGTDLLTPTNMEKLWSIESEVLGLRAQDPDDSSTQYSFSETCEKTFPTYADGSTG